jgi:hypothetical protein
MKLLLKVFASLIVCVMLAGAQTALADDLYRCGNTYQDTPCKGVASKPINEKPAKKPPINNNVAPANKKVVDSKVAAAPITEADCKKRGEDAKVVARLRDIGVHENDQLTIATDVEKKALIKKVYGHSGNAFQIQNAVEKECLQQLQKTNLTSKWMSQARSLLGFGGAPKPTEASVKDKAKPAPKIKTATTQPAKPQVRSTADPKPVIEPDQPMAAPTAQPEPNAQPEQAPAPVIQPEPVIAQPEPPPAPPEPEPTPVAPPAPVAQKEEAPAADSQGMCSALKAGLANIASQKRKGGDAAFMKDLRDQQTELENVMKSAGC